MHDVELVVEAANGDAETVARVTRQIQDDIRADGRLAVTRKEAVAPAGSRTGAATQIGALIVSGLFSATTVKAVRDIVLRRMSQREESSLTVRWTAGDIHGHFTVDTQGQPPAELSAAVVKAWSRSSVPGSVGAGTDLDATVILDEAGLKEIEDGPQARAADRD